MAKKAKACKTSYVPFVKALRKKDLEECVAIINGEISWLNLEHILPNQFIRNGRACSYHGNGQKWVDCNYVDDKLQGKYESFRENGQKRVKCTYLNGKFHGKYEKWNSKGRKVKDYNYVDGKVNNL